MDQGFELVGVCSADDAASHAEFKAWLDRGMDAGMDYLRNSIELRKGAQRLLPGAKSVIAVGLNYFQEQSCESDEPHVARYALGRDYHKVVRAKLRLVERQLRRYVPTATTRICVDSAPIFEREYAQRAGMGWYGKNTMLINSQRGSWFFLGLLLTNVQLRPDAPAKGGCGNCRVCVEACPTGCIVETDLGWRVNANQCISYLTIEHKGTIEQSLRAGIGSWTFGCDVCQEVCPFNHPRDSQPMRARVTRERDFLAKRSLPSLEQIVRLSKGEWDILTRGSAIRRAGFEGLRRNAGINIENCNRDDS